MLYVKTAKLKHDDETSLWSPALRGFMDDHAASSPSSQVNSKHWVAVWYFPVIKPYDCDGHVQ